MLNDEELSRLKFKVHKFTKDLGKRIPEFQRSEIITKFAHKNKDAVLRYAVLMYDKGTPYTKKFKTLEVRKNEVAEYCGFRRTGEDWDDNTKKMMNWRDPKVNEVFLEIIKIQSELKWAHRIALENNYWENYSRLLRPITVEDENKEIAAQTLKDKLRESNKNILEEMDVLDRDLFGDDNEGIEAAKEIRMTSPTAIARAYA